MNENQLKKIISLAKKIPVSKINDKLSSINNEKWDSLAQLYILSMLDKTTKGKTTKIKGLNEILSYKKLLSTLKLKKIIK